jgi:hypothetical protein
MFDFLTLEDSAERARWIDRLYSAPQVRSLAELLIDLETDPAARAFVVGMLRERAPIERPPAEVARG